MERGKDAGPANCTIIIIIISVISLQCPSPTIIIIIISINHCRYFEGIFSVFCSRRPPSHNHPVLVVAAAAAALVFFSCCYLDRTWHYLLYFIISSVVHSFVRSNFQRPFEPSLKHIFNSHHHPCTSHSRTQHSQYLEWLL